MILKAQALMKMQDTDNDGRRIPFHMLVLTANKELFRKMVMLEEQQKQYEKDSPEYNTLQKQIDECDVSGKLIEHDNCVLSAPRGIHAAKQKLYEREAIKNPNNNANRTRNVLLMPGETYCKIHNSLLFEFNHEQVIY